MNTLQNQHQKPHPNPTLIPGPNPNPNPKTAPLANSKALTFDEVSKFFSLPLSDAADSLGVCTSVLKKICHENGLVRWPHRKFLSGKSIEEIKEDAARGKNKLLNDERKDAGQKSDALTSSTVSLLPSVPELSKAQSVMQPQGNKNSTPHIGSPQKLDGSNLTKGTPANLDEFKYGFPSDGLSTVTYKWWGNSSPDCSKSSPVDLGEDTQGNKNSATKSMDGDTIMSTTDGEKNRNKTHGSSIDSLGTGSLSSLRKKAVKEGREALKIGVHRGFSMNKLDATKRSVLLQIFKSSLPGEWGDESL